MLNMLHHNLLITILFRSKSIFVLAIRTVLCCIESKMNSYIDHSVLNNHLGSNIVSFYIQSCVITCYVLKRLRVIFCHEIHV